MFVILYEYHCVNFRTLYYGCSIRPPNKSAYWKIIFFISHPKKYVVGTKKKRLNETVLLNTQNTCLNQWVRK